MRIPGSLGLWPFHLMRLTKWIGLALFASLFLSCDDSVDPFGEFVPRMAVYSVLSAESDTQYVRVVRSYRSPDDLTEGDLAVRDAVVEITDGSQTVVFSDTLLERSEPSEFGDSVFVYVARGFKPVPGTTYTLTVTSPSAGTISATTRVPPKSNLSTDYSQNVVIRNPWSSVSNPVVSFTISPGASAFLVRFRIEYEDITPSGVIQKAIDVPDRLVVVSCFQEVYDFQFRTASSTGGSSGKLVKYDYPHFSYRRCVELVNERSYNNRFLRAKFTVVQFNDEWYKYYTSARTFQDRFSIRIDQPDYSPVPGGLGVFGGYVVDTISVNLPVVMQTSRPDLWSACE